MIAVNIRIPDQLNDKLLSFTKTMELPKSYLIRQAIKNYMLELQEDAEDIAAAEEVLANSTGETISLENMIKELGLEDEMEN